MKELYLAGKQELLLQVFSEIKGVEDVVPGIAVDDNGQTAIGIRLQYNPKKQDICGLLQEYFSIVDPFAEAEISDEQCAVFYNSAEDMMQLEYYARFLQSRGHEPSAALGNLIVNDSIDLQQEIRPLQVRFGHLQRFNAV